MPASSHSSDALNHIFVDYENMKSVPHEIIGIPQICITLFLGPQQKNLSVELVEKIISHALNVQIVRLNEAGKNALDFTLVYYMGQAVLTHPGDRFHLVSKDTGYDPLISHLKSRRVHVQRHSDYDSLLESCPTLSTAFPGPINLQAEKAIAPSVKKKVAIKAAKTAPAKSITSAKEPPKPSLFEQALKHLRHKNQGRPTRQKTLHSHLLDHFRKQASSAEVDQVIKKLCESELIETQSVPSAPDNFKIMAYKL